MTLNLLFNFNQKNFKKIMENMTQTERRTININKVVQMLTEEGKSRKEIQEYYGLNGAEAKILFSHEKVKGVKTKKKPNIFIVDEPLAEVASSEVLQANTPAYIREVTQPENDSFTN